MRNLCDSLRTVDQPDTVIREIDRVSVRDCKVESASVFCDVENVDDIFDDLTKRQRHNRKIIAAQT